MYMFYRSSNKKPTLIVRAVAIILILALVMPAPSEAQKSDKKSDKKSNKKSETEHVPPKDEIVADIGKPTLLPPGPIKLPPGAPVFDVTKHGAKGDGKPNMDEEGGCANAISFIQAWRKACDSPGPAKVLIPPGDFVVGQVMFVGPCKSAPIMVENQGTVLANTDLSLYPSAEWLVFEKVDNVIFTGSGVVNGQGPKTWDKNDCKKNDNCAPLPSSIKLYKANNTIVDGVKSIDSMFFHVFVSACTNVTLRGINLVAPDLSPNTDGIHTSRSKQIYIYDSVIGTGDDCVSVGQGSQNIFVSNVKCGPGHGISIGSLGKEDEEEDVRGIFVRNCTFSNTQNGVRIKTWPGKVDTVAENILYEDIIMDNVKNPIIIDATYSNKKNTPSNIPSHVKLSDIQFKNIRGTAATGVVLSLNCSAAIPCDKVVLSNIQLKAAPDKTPLVSCLNAKVTMLGNNDGIVCRS